MKISIKLGIQLSWPSACLSFTRPGGSIPSTITKEKKKKFHNGFLGLCICVYVPKYNKLNLQTSGRIQSPDTYKTFHCQVEKTSNLWITLVAHKRSLTNMELKSCSFFNKSWIYLVYKWGPREITSCEFSLRDAQKDLSVWLCEQQQDCHM